MWEQMGTLCLMLVDVMETVPLSSGNQDRLSTPPPRVVLFSTRLGSTRVAVSRLSAAEEKEEVHTIMSATRAAARLALVS